jgi:hypothetical protein
MGAIWQSVSSAVRDDPYVFGIGVLLLAIVYFLWRKPGPGLVQVLFGIIPSAFLLAVWLASLILWLPAGWLMAALALIIPFQSIFLGLLELPGRFSRNNFLRGNRKDLAERLWPAAIYPDLYRQVPPDIIRPPYEDGRLIGGYPISSLADRVFNEEVYLSGMRIGAQAALVFLLVMFVPLVLGPLHRLALLLPYLNGATGPVIERWPGLQPVAMSAHELWHINYVVGSQKLAETASSFFLSFPFDLIIAVGIALITGPLVLNHWMRRATASYSFVTKDADVRWPFRIETRNLLRATYRRQVLHATEHLKEAPTFLVGSASGTLRVRGDLTAPMPRQPVMMDRESIFQHLMVFGGTGEGKTTAMLKPLLRQILQDKKFGAFVADAKGVLWQDAMRVARDLGREKECVLIGTGEGQFGVNVVAGLSPTQIAATLRSVLVQIGNVAGDSFWPDMAAGLLRQMLTLGQGYAGTAEGKKEAAMGRNPYSLWWAYQAVLRSEIANAAIKAIRSEHEDNVKAIKEAKTEELAEAAAARDRALMTPELRDTVAYLETAWREMAAETRTGIIANVTQLLDGFAGSPLLRERFISGRSENTVSLRDALDGKIILNTLSSIEDGLPARLVSILLKTVLYREARRRESEFKAQRRSPQDEPCLVVMDEVQELATVDPSSGLSDASFWNVARSTGLAGIFATQTLAALTQSMGEEAAQNFIQQARSKVFFRTEERGTVEYACWCAGEYERNRVFDDGHRESIEYRQLIDGWEPFADTSDGGAIPSDPNVLIRSALSLVSGEALSFESLPVQKAYEADRRFVPNVKGVNIDDPSQQLTLALASLQAEQAAAWRADDLTRQYRSEGNERTPALNASDMMNMGRWHAFAHIQRAGAVRQDIVAVNHDFS